jgi:phage terminase small subunit
MPQLTERQARFVEEYLQDANVRGAARRAGYNEMVGFRLVRRAEVADAICVGQAARAERMQVSADRVIAELAAIAFSDITRVMSWGGREGDGEAETAEGDAGERYDFRLRKSAMLDRRTAAAVKEFRRYSHGAVRVRMHDKLPALMLLARHLGLLGPGGGMQGREPEEVEDEFGFGEENKGIVERLAELPRWRRDQIRAEINESVARALRGE